MSMAIHVLDCSRLQNSNKKGPEEKALLDDEKNEEFMKVQQRKHKQSDLAQEAEPSFWGGEFSQVLCPTLMQEQAGSGC